MNKEWFLYKNSKNECLSKSERKLYRTCERLVTKKSNLILLIRYIETYFPFWILKVSMSTFIFLAC
jgi:hypothetical protein